MNRKDARNRVHFMSEIYNKAGIPQAVKVLSKYFDEMEIAWDEKIWEDFNSYTLSNDIAQHLIDCHPNWIKLQVVRTGSDVRIWNAGLGQDWAALYEIACPDDTEVLVRLDEALLKSSRSSGNPNRAAKSTGEKDWQRRRAW